MILEAPNLELEETTSKEIEEAKKVDNAIEAAANTLDEIDPLVEKVSSPNTEVYNNSEPEPPVSDDGQASLF